ncbi:hypothetical protein FOXYSP1_09278 [Fusarium oxysporum f. sp. phaseoli]
MSFKGPGSKHGLVCCTVFAAAPEATRRNPTLVRRMYFSPERELVEHAIKFSQRQIEGKVNLVAYKLRVYRWTFQRDL